MSSVEALREFINQRLTAAAGEIFTVFQQTIVRYEEEIHRKLVTNRGNPRSPVTKAEVPEQHGGAMEQLFQHQGDSGPEPGEVDRPRIKEEHEELCTGGEGDQLPLSLESGAFMMAFTNQPSDFMQPEAEPEPLPSYDSAAVDRCDLKVDGCEFNAALSSAGSEDQSPLRPKPSESHAARRSSETCRQTFGKRRPLLPHQRRLAGEKKDSCEMCRESFSTHAELLVHMRSHTDEKPYSCQMCGKRFGVHRNLLVHMRTHTGEKPYSCAMCGRSFSKHSNLLRHIRTHTGEKPFPCTLCDKSFRQQSHLLRHTRTHRE